MSTRETDYFSHLLVSPPHKARGDDATDTSDVRSQFNNLTTKSIPHRVVSEFETVGVAS